MDSTQAKLETEAGEEGTTLILQEGVWAGRRDNGDCSGASHKELCVDHVYNPYLGHRAHGETSVETKPYPYKG